MLKGREGRRVNTGEGNAPPLPGTCSSSSPRSPRQPRVSLHPTSPPLQGPREFYPPSFPLPLLPQNLQLPMPSAPEPAECESQLNCVQMDYDPTSSAFVLPPPSSIPTAIPLPSFHLVSPPGTPTPRACSVARPSPEEPLASSVAERSGCRGPGPAAEHLLSKAGRWPSFPVAAAVLFRLLAN